MKVQRFIWSLIVAGTFAASSFWLMGTAYASDMSFSFNPLNNAQIPGNLPANAVPIQVTVNCNTALCGINSISASLTGPSGASVNLSANGPLASCSPVVFGTGCGEQDFSWNTQPVSSPNGKYTLNASANDSGLNAGNGSGSETLLLNNAPSAPSGVSAALNPSAGNTPLVTWKANPEPDITGYEIFRSGSGSSAAAFSAGAGVTSYQDTTAPQGVAVSYIVVAVRSSPVWSSGITSCGGQAPCSNPSTSQETPAVTVPAPASAQTQQLPNSVATADPPKPVTGATGAVSTKAPITLGQGQLKPITAPSLPTTIVQLPEPNVVQFAPLLPYSGKIPEQAITSSVPAPVEATNSPTSTGATVALPVLGKVKTVDAFKYIAAAAVLIVGAVHLTRYARKLTRAGIPSESSSDS